MAFWNRSKKNEEEVVKDESEVETFVRVCGGEDTKAYKLLYDVLNLSPGPFANIDVEVKKAEKFEKEAQKYDPGSEGWIDKIKDAIFLYRYSGQLAIYNDDVEKVREYFNKEIELRKKIDPNTPKNSYPFLQEENIEFGMKKAREYYQARELMENKSLY